MKEEYDLNTPLRMRFALPMLRSWSGFPDYDPFVVRAVHRWIDGGMKGPVPFPKSTFFKEWAKRQGWANVDGFVGYRFEAAILPPKRDGTKKCMNPLFPGDPSTCQFDPCECAQNWDEDQPCPVCGNEERNRRGLLVCECPCPTTLEARRNIADETIAALFPSPHNARTKEK